jgi:DNA polymerase elongation subunit (family B)
MDYYVETKEKVMSKEEKLKKIEELKRKASELKKEVDYYNALQLALKLVLNGSYGAFATSYFILYNNHVAGTITAQGRDLTRTMDKVNEDYWYKQWHNDHELHYILGVKNITSINKSENVSIYADTDSLFVSFKPAIDHCTWENLHLNDDYLDFLDKKFIILTPDTDFKYKSSNLVGIAHNVSDLEELLKNDYDTLIFDGHYVKDRRINKMMEDGVFTSEIVWNWSNETDFIQGMDFFRYAGYFKKCLEEYAGSFGVENKEDFELERISESIINIAKKKYIQHILFEDGIPYERLNYIYPKGVELVRSSTPAFARDKIVGIVKYLFSHPDTFNIKDLLKLVKQLRKEFELADIDDISMQSSCSNYEIKVLNDKTLPLQFVSGAHFAVKSAAHHNYLLIKNKEYQQKYEFIKSGAKIKYYVCKDKSVTDMFAYTRGSFPHEFAPPIDFDEQFEKSILSPINSIIAPLGLPEITKRLSVVMDIFGGFGRGGF